MDFELLTLIHKQIPGCPFILLFKGAKGTFNKPVSTWIKRIVKKCIVP